MSKAKVLIVEDEPLIADDIAVRLEKHGYEVVGIADEAHDALQIIEEKKPDIVLLDVNIEGNVDGISLAAQLSIPFVFITSYYDQKTLDRAKLTNPSGYIVKPFNERDLIANLEIAQSRGSLKVEEKRPPEKLFLRKDQEIISVLSSDIIFAEAYDNYAYVYTNNDKFLISHTLKSVEDKLVPLGFMRVHRSFLINFEHIDSISEGMVFLKGHKVQLGKSYKKSFLERLSML